MEARWRSKMRIAIVHPDLGIDAAVELVRIDTMSIFLISPLTKIGVNVNPFDEPHSCISAFAKLGTVEGGILQDYNVAHVSLVIVGESQPFSLSPFKLNTLKSTSRQVSNVIMS
ncbi:uncharacterized protein LOC111810333 [Cucurbita pepo subsp. pepo]|uniref:uncharacterized protein LOC111810333 n=1 Tax=Cucurbita pepo subsp. pepo TaxID=3664 RepID=UPI000C9D3734|nr:uncharacterized protein LOC111810333 [Cucurbita pepo subsp. pepo]